MIVSAYHSTAALVLGLDAPWVARLAALAVVAAAGAFALRHIAGGALPRSIRIGIDRRIDVVARDGQATSGEIVADSYVGPRITTIVWRPDGAWRVRTLLVLPDTLAAGDFRHLRVMLRYGRAPVAAVGNSDEDAG